MENLYLGKNPRRWCHIATRMVPRSMEKAMTHSKQIWNARIFLAD